jgi:hypothetical protein
MSPLERYQMGWNAALDAAISAIEKAGDARVIKWQGTELEDDAKARAWDAVVCAAILRKLKIELSNGDVDRS